MKVPFIILASASPRRKMLLGQLKRDFEVIPSSATEIHHNQLSPGEMTQINAYRKALAVSNLHPDALVIGMDTVVALQEHVFGKPKNMEEAHEMVLRLQGRDHHVVTGVCLAHLRTMRVKVFAELTDVRFRPLTEEQIRHYHSKMNPLDKAGAYGIQDHGELIVESITGSFSNVVGLPMERLQEELEKWEREK